MAKQPRKVATPTSPGPPTTVIPTAPVLPAMLPKAPTAAPARVVKSKVAAPPTIDEIQQWASKDKQRWEKRNLRFERHQRLFDLKQTVNAKEGEVVVYMNDTKVVIEKPAAMVARKGYRIECPPRGEENLKAAQRIENWCRYVRGIVNQEAVESMHNPLEYDIAQSSFLRGWICSRLMLDDEHPGFVNETLFDAYNVFPTPSGHGYRRVIHQYQTTVGELLDDFPEAAATYEGQTEDSKVDVTAYYSGRAPYYHAVIAGGVWVKEPVDLEYFPWIISTAKGRFSYTPIGTETAEDITEFIGEGFLTAIEGLYKLINQFLTIMANTAAKSENPPMVVQTVDGQPKEVKLGAGARTFFVNGEDYKVIDVGAHAAEFMPLLASLQSGVSKATMPEALYGNGGGPSGYADALAMGAAADTLSVFTESIAYHHAQRYTKRLQLYKTYGAESIEILGPAPADSAELRGRRVWGDKLTPADVMANGTYVECSFDSITPQDKIGLAAAAVQLVREKIISLRTARAEWAGVDDPELENDRVLRELIYLNQQATEELSRLSMERAKSTDELQALDAAARAKDAAAKLQAQQAAGPPGPPGGPPGGNVDMQGANGMPSNVLPAPQGGQIQTGGQNLQAQLAALAGGR